MVKRLMKFFAYSLFFIAALIVFIPKSSLYFLLEKNLKKFDVVISNETLHPNLFSLNIQNLEITTKGIDSATVGDANIQLLILSNSLEFSDIKLSSLVEAYLPSKIESLEVHYTLFNPLEITLNAHGGFGDASGSLNILERDINITLSPSKKMKSQYKKTMRLLKKSENGEYVYAKTFK